MIVGIHHIAIGVPDLDRALTFYRDVLGFEQVQSGDWDRDFPLADQAIGLAQTSARMAMLKTSNAHIELWQYRNPVPDNKRSDPNDYGYPHFALQVDDIDHEVARLTEAGMTFVGPPVPLQGSAAVYGRDPFGNVIELYEIKDPDIAQLRRD